MIIVDTSIWIDYFNKNEIIFNHMLHLIERGEVYTIGCIFAELLQGCRTNKEYQIIKEYYNYLPTIYEKDIWIKAGEYSYKNKLIQKGVGLIDAVICMSAVINNGKIWTNEKKIKKSIFKSLIYEF